MVARDRIELPTRGFSGQTLLIDASGPAVSQLVFNPSAPIKNDQLNPVTVNLSITLSEPINTGGVPTLSYRLSGPARLNTPITPLTQTDTLVWNGQFQLPADGGLTQVENLSFVYQGIDDLGNISTTVPNPVIQVYQGDLPAFNAPTGLTAKALPGGAVQLDWKAVTSAVDYEIYRQGPSDIQPILLARNGGALTYTDNPGIDDTYQYAVASVRNDNGQEAVSALSALVQVTTDSLAPNSPQSLALQLASNGIYAQWLAPAAGGSGAETITYTLYRSSALVITSVAGLTPILTGITTLDALDPNPSESDHAYVVTAVDTAGNESAPSNSIYLNFDLLPVSTLSVVQEGSNAPVISWTHSGSTVVGFDVYLGEDGSTTKLNTGLIIGNNFTDSGYSSDRRRYTVKAVDGNQVESPPRAIILPKVTVQRADNTPIKRGIMNSLAYDVSNAGTDKLVGLKLQVDVGGKQHTTNSFSVNAGITDNVNVIVGGYDNLTGVSPLTTTLTQTPNVGETVQIIRHSQVNVSDDGLVLSLITQDFTRGGTGAVHFTLENTSAVESEILTAINTGNADSTEIRFKLLDGDGNVLSTQSFRQALGAKVITLSNGQTVARLQAGETFTSGTTNVVVPSSAPSQVTLKLEIDNLRYHTGQTDAVIMQGLNTTLSVPLIDTAYTGAIDSITPATSFGGQDIIITGRAVDRVTGLPLAAVSLNLIVTRKGFERSFNVITDSTGSFSHPTPRPRTSPAPTPSL